MKIGSLLQPELIQLHLKIDSKETAIKMMIDHMNKIYKFKEPEKILSAVLERESLGGTTFETGIAIPHARLSDFDDLIIGVCVPETPIIEGLQEIQCIFVILTSISVSNLYLKTLSCLIKISQDINLWRRLLSSSTPSDFLTGLTDIYVKKELTTEDIMEPTFCKVTPETNLKELADIFYKTNETYAAVIDTSDKFIGEVAIADLIKIGIPDYAYMVGNLNFLSTLEPFEELLKNEEKIPVKKIMRKPQINLKPDTSVIEAALEITQANRRQLPVVNGDKIVGLLKITGILNKIIRG